ncbi:MAG: 2-C-methyl-D-erythritol 4-phosphate cytidylyltransferase [Pseudomonadota bacterium]
MNSQSNPKYWAVVPAAGSGQRMRAEVAKQYLQINGKPILQITLETLLNHSSIEQVVVCLASDDQHWTSLPCAEHARIISATGGASRAQSVLNGLLALSSTTSICNEDWVLVHDAARPCLDQHMLDKLLEELVDDPVGGLLAIPAKDTLKYACGTDQRIERTLDRARVWQAQTPQMFRFGVLRDALQRALEAGLEITDESFAVEQAGYQPMLIEGDALNIKVTTPEDLQIAQKILETNSSN